MFALKYSHKPSRVNLKIAYYGEIRALRLLCMMYVERLRAHNNDSIVNSFVSRNSIPGAILVAKRKNY